MPVRFCGSMRLKLLNLRVGATVGPRGALTELRALHRGRLNLAAE